MPKNPLWTIAQSGATDGQAPLWSDADGAYVPGDISAGGSSDVFDFREYGAVGDWNGSSGTDDTGPISDCIDDYNAAGGGLLRIPRGFYKTTSDLPPITAPGTILGRGSANGSGVAGASLIYRGGTTGVPLTISSHAVRLHGFGLVNSTGVTQTAGAGIRVTAGDQMDLRDVSVYGFYDCIDVEDGGLWTASRLWLVGPLRYGLYVRHIDQPDGGDMKLDKVFIYAKDRNASAALRYESGGGLGLENFKFNDYGGTGKFSVGLDVNITATTGVLNLANGSIENINGPGIKGRESGGGSFQAVTIDGIQFGYYAGTSASAIDIDGWNDVTIDAITALANPGGSSAPVVKLANVTRGAIGSITNDGFTGDYTLTSCTGIKLPGDVPSSRQVSSGTGLTGGGDLSADRTLAADIGTGASQVAAGNHTHVGTSSGEALMQDGVTGPPVPIENEARSDWLYQG